MLTATVTFFSSGSLELRGCVHAQYPKSFIIVRYLEYGFIYLYYTHAWIKHKLTIVTSRCRSNLCWRLFANGISREVTGIKSRCLFARRRKTYQRCTSFLFLNSKVSEGKHLSLLPYDNYLYKDWLFLKFWKRPTSSWPDIT